MILAFSQSDSNDAFKRVGTCAIVENKKRCSCNTNYLHNIIFKSRQYNFIIQLANHSCAHECTSSLIFMLTTKAAST